MSGGGQKPGHRRGGRKHGQLNKRTIEKQLAKKFREENAARAAEIAKELGLTTPPASVGPREKKLAKDVLEEFMMLFAGMAAAYQPSPPGYPKRSGEDPTKFQEYAELAARTAEKLAPFQSPRYSAVIVGQTQAKRIIVNGGLPKPGLTVPIDSQVELPEMKVVNGSVERGNNDQPSGPAPEAGRVLQREPTE